MSNAVSDPSNTARLLGQVRRSLRFWSLLDGVTIALCLTTLGFWISLALDYLADVWLDAPWGLRLGVSLVWLAALLAVFSYWVARRMGDAARQSSLALLVERKLPELKDRLLTAVELSSSQHPFSRSLVRESIREADSQLSGFQVSSLFERGPVIRRSLLVALLFASVVLLAAAAPAVAETWARRVVLLENVMYPRRSHLTVVGMPGPVQKIARGRSFEILVEAAQDSVVPKNVMVHVRMLQSGERSRVSMTKIGKYRFRYILRSVLEPIQFQVTGGDARTPEYRLETVEPPVIEEATVNIQPPDYTGRSASRVAVSGSPIPVPYASQVHVELRANKELVHMSATNADGNLPLDRTGPSSFSVALDVRANQAIRVQLEDSDGIDLEEPFPLDLSAIVDEAPKITATRWGVSAAITSVASVPLDITITDDYGVASASMEYSVDAVAKGQQEVQMAEVRPTDVKDRITFEVDALNLQPSQRLTLAVVATDTDSIPGPKTARSESIPFEIVTPEELLSRLATRELELRQRFEQVTNELRDARAGLEMIRRQLSDASEEATTSRRLHADRAVGVARKDAVETAVIATSFQGIVDELVLNRVGNSTLLERLNTGVNKPMAFLVETGFPSAIIELSHLVQATDPAELEVALGASEASLDDLLARCEGILKAMAKLESFNEVVAMLRSIMEEQRGVLEETKKIRKDQIRQLLDLEE